MTERLYTSPVPGEAVFIAGVKMHIMSVETTRRVDARAVHVLKGSTVEITIEEGAHVTINGREWRP